MKTLGALFTGKQAKHWIQKRFLNAGSWYVGEFFQAPRTGKLQIISSTCTFRDWVRELFKVWRRIETQCWRCFYFQLLVVTPIFSFLLCFDLFDNLQCFLLYACRSVVKHLTNLDGQYLYTWKDNWSAPLFFPEKLLSLERKFNPLE